MGATTSQQDNVAHNTVERWTQQVHTILETVEAWEDDVESAKIWLWGGGDTSYLDLDSLSDIFSMGDSTTMAPCNVVERLETLYVKLKQVEKRVQSMRDVRTQVLHLKKLTDGALLSDDLVDHLHVTIDDLDDLDDI